MSAGTVVCPRCGRRYSIRKARGGDGSAVFPRIHYTAAPQDKEQVHVANGRTKREYCDGSFALIDISEVTYGRD